MPRYTLSALVASIALTACGEGPPSPQPEAPITLALITAADLDALGSTEALVVDLAQRRTVTLVEAEGLDLSRVDVAFLGGARVGLTAWLSHAPFGVDILDSDNNRFALAGFALDGADLPTERDRNCVCAYRCYPSADGASGCRGRCGGLCPTYPTYNGGDPEGPAPRNCVVINGRYVCDGGHY